MKLCLSAKGCLSLSLVAEYVLLVAIPGSTVGEPALADLSDIESRKNEM